MSPAKGAMLGGLISGVGNIVSGGLNLWNSRWMQSHADNRADSAYQRAVADMTKAGLNPAMMYGGGGVRPADSPMVGAQNIAGGDLFGGLAEGVNSAAKLRLETNRLKMQERMTTAEVAKAEAEADSAKANAARARVEALRTENLWPAELDRQKAGLFLDWAHRDLTQANARAARATVPEKEARGKLGRSFGDLLDVLGNLGDPRSTGEIWKQDVIDPAMNWARGKWKTMSDFFAGGKGNANGGANSAKEYRERVEQRQRNSFDKRGF